MARISSSSVAPTGIPELEDLEPYIVTLQSVVKGTGAEQYGSQPQLELTWVLEDGSTIKDWPAIKLGKSRDSGKVSKLRSMLNAIAGKPEATEIAWFDDEEPFEWSYDGDEPFASLMSAGLTVIVRGKTTIKEDPQWGEVARYRIVAYQPVKRQTASSRPKPAATSVAVDEDPIPF